MHFDEALKERALETDQLKRERYVATNRFRVRAGKTATFEKRWATRKSRLATLDGFRFFTLLKRVATVGFDKEAPDYEEGNYVSFTIWQDKPSFDAWRTGDAFKEAHGGGKFNLSGFVGLLTTALFIIKGSPKPAFYDGLLSTTDGYLAHSPLLSAANENAEGGWRKVMADGINEIRPEVFVTQDLYSVKEGMKGQFEQSFSTKLKSHKIDFPDMTFAERESQGKGDSSNGDNGMLSFTLLRRDADKADDGVTHAVWRLWTNQAAYDAWKTSFHSPPFLTELTSAPPKTALYEGKLTLFSEQGP
jgi:heme-degrading monooxygenase HmoA